MLTKLNCSVFLPSFYPLSTPITYVCVLPKIKLLEQSLNSYISNILLKEVLKYYQNSSMWYVVEHADLHVLLHYPASTDMKSLSY